MLDTADLDVAAGFLVGEYSVRPLSGEVEAGGGAVHLEPKVMDVLVCLARARGAIVTRRALLDAVWPGVAVSEEALTRCISALRDAFRDDGQPRRFVRTIPKRGYALVAQVRAQEPWAHDSSLRAPNGRIEASVAVLPFLDLSPDGGFAWFAAGLTEDLIDSLARIEGLHIAARTSSFTARENTADVREIGSRLGVEHVLEGSVRRADGRLRVSARLASARDGFQLWSESFERELSDVLALQAEIARAVALRLALRLTAGKRHEATAPVRIEAYDAYLRGRAKYQTERPGFHVAGVEELERAMALDPSFAPAHGLHAYIHALSAALIEPYPALAGKVRASLQRALSLDPLQPEALMAKAIDVRWRTWDWTEVRALFDQALRVAPGDAHVLTQFAVRLFRDTDQLETAADLLRRAVALDPLNAAPRASLSYMLRYAGDAEGAVREAERALALNPEHGWAARARAFALTSAGRLPEAREAVAALAATGSAEHESTLEARGRLEVARGDVPSARRTAARIEELAQGPRGAMYMDAAAWVRLELGHIQKGIAWLERELTVGASGVVSARVCAHPVEARRPGLLRLPRFQQLLRRMRLDDESLAKWRAEGAFEPPSL